MWFFTSRKPRPATSARRVPATRQLRLETLEDRVVPTSLSYSTFLNGIGVYASAVDSAGDVYVTGEAGSGFSTTPGAFETSGYGAFVAKLNATGTAVLYATYLGNGSGNEEGTGIAVDSAGDAFVIGKNLNVPTTPNAIASSATVSGQDFVAELNPAGSGLVYSTYLPGTLGAARTFGLSGAIAIDGSGNIDVAGAAGAGFPVTAGAYQTAFLGGGGTGTRGNAFFAKINPALSGSASLLYATYLGGNGTLGDQASGIALDGAGNAYVTGVTSSTNFPTTSGAVQRSNGSTYGGYDDAFVAKFNPALSGTASLVYSTYLGGGGANGYVSSLGVQGDTIAQTNGGIAVDSAGNAYVTSSTASINFPTTAGAFQVKSSFGQNGNDSGPSDAFVTKLNATGTALVYSTYLGGGSTTGSGGTAIALDANGDAYVTGWTNSTTFPTKNPLQPANGGGYDAFVTALNPSGSGLLFSSYLGGSGNDDGFGIALDSQGNVYVGGGTGSSNFPTTAGTYQTTAGSGFVSKITPVVGPSFAVNGPSSLTAGTGGTFTVTALNADGSVNLGYTGTVHFTSSDPKAVLPGNLAISGGTGTFNVTLETAGTQSITATDLNNSSMAGFDAGVAVSPAAATHFVLSAPSSVSANTVFSLTVTAVDAYGNVATGYRGTIEFSDSASGATLPRNYTFTAADNGLHTFATLKLKTKGMQTLTIMDTLNNALIVNILISVS